MNRRGFLQSMLAAGVGCYLPRAESMMRLVVRKRASGVLLMVNCTDMVEVRRATNWIDVTTIVDTHKQFAMGLYEYTYHVPEVELMPGTIGPWKEGQGPGAGRSVYQITTFDKLQDKPVLYADGRRYDGAYELTDRGSVLIRNLELEDFANRLPAFTFE